MPESKIALRIDGESFEAEAGSSVASAVLQSGRLATRRSRRGEPRGPLCGMGICFECRLTVDGVPNVRSCLLPVAPGMEIATDG
jgi:aerobic-type carbon monoxide dehydrogenase small subunit (CoxS/CutS family)